MGVPDNRPGLQDSNVDDYNMEQRTTTMPPEMSLTVGCLPEVRPSSVTRGCMMRMMMMMLMVMSVQNGS